jgi:hypothetical protein
MLKHLHCDLGQPDYGLKHRHKTDRLATDSCKTQTPPDPITDVTIVCLHFLLPELPLSERNFKFFRITRATHSYSQDDVHWLLYRMCRIKRNPCLGWEIFKIVIKQKRDICFLKFGNISCNALCCN